ncbi:MAG: zinc ABC transporter substrate-binding protein [Deltaproteobacteria bacterium]|nr:zinc ABC transporter substrate-binding protein [Deltaproteobacteria bacterium]
MRKAWKTALAVVVAFGLWGMGLPCTVQAGEALRVTVSILPQKYFVDRIGGDRVAVGVMVLPGASPAIYEPKPRQMADLVKSRIYFATGVPFEGVWISKFEAANPEMRIVRTDKGIEKRAMKARHDHGGEDHDGGIQDPHVWLSPPLVMLQARHILDALCREDPENREGYESNYRGFISDLVELDLKIRSLFSGIQGRPRFMVYHPSWGYFSEAYGLEQIPVEMEGKAPSPRALEDLIRYAGQEGVRVVFVQPQFPTRSAETIARAIGGQAIEADPLAPDWANNLLKAAGVFRRALK